MCSNFRFYYMISGWKTSLLHPLLIPNLKNWLDGRCSVLSLQKKQQRKNRVRPGHTHRHHRTRHVTNYSLECGTEHKNGWEPAFQILIWAAQHTNFPSFIRLLYTMCDTLWETIMSDLSITKVSGHQLQTAVLDPCWPADFRQFAMALTDKKESSRVWAGGLVQLRPAESSGSCFLDVAKCLTLIFHH